VEKVILLLCLVGLVFGAYIVDQPDAARGKDDALHSAYPSSNYGLRQYLYVQNHSAGISVPIIEFDTISVIPITAVIDSAKITFVAGGGTGGTSVITVSRLLKSWIEGRGSQSVAIDGEPTWTWQAKPTTWTTAGALGIDDCAAPQDSAVWSVGSSGVSYITNALQTIVSSGVNYGIILRARTYDTWFGIRSSDMVGSEPTFEVWWTEAAPESGAKWRGAYIDGKLQTWRTQ